MVRASPVFPEGKESVGSGDLMEKSGRIKGGYVKDQPTTPIKSIKQTATDCKELIVERQRLEQMIKDLQTNGGIEEAKDYSGGFAEKFSK